MNSNTCTYLAPDYDARTSRISPAPYCGCTSLEGQNYCDAHYPLVYNVGTAHRRRHKDIRVAAALQDLGSLFNDVVAELEHAGELDL